MKDKKKKIIFLIVMIISITLIGLESIGYILIHNEIEEWKSNLKNLDEGKNSKEQLEKAIYLRKKIERLSPRGIYIVIDSAKNILYLKRRNSIIKRAVVSCGSGSILKEPNGKRRWVFDTPKGTFSINSKIKNPSWRKPDWAFIEEGEPVPEEEEKRIERGVLGDYALGFGEGYFLHGTLYTRLLGRNVTHGCIRVGDEDLETIFKNTEIGTLIIIY